MLETKIDCSGNGRQGWSREENDELMFCSVVLFVFVVKKSLFFVLQCTIQISFYES